MAKFVFVFRGGAPTSPEEGEKMMAAWTAWLEGMGTAVLDPGAAVGASEFVGTADAQPVSGYMTVDAADMEAAKTLARAYPIMGAGGSVEVAPALDM